MTEFVSEKVKLETNFMVCSSGSAIHRFPSMPREIRLLQ